MSPSTVAAEAAERRPRIGFRTVGDLARFMERTEDVPDPPVSDVITCAPKIASRTSWASRLCAQSREWEAMAIVAVSGGVLVGGVHPHDLLRAGAA